MKLEGDLKEIDLVSHLLELADERFTGAIRFENDGIIKILYFKDGDVLSASTNDRADSVDEILLRAGKVSRDHVRQALGKRKDNETLGDALLSMGFISRKELTWGRRTQIVGILRSVGNWPAGSYQIVHDYLPNREEGTLFYLPQIILELAVTDPDKAGVERRVEGGDAVYRKRPDFKERYARLALNEDADAIVEQIDRSRTAAEVAAVSNLDVFSVYKLLLALEALGMVDRDKPEVLHEVSPPAEELSSSLLTADALEEFSPPAEVPHPLPKPASGGVEERGLEEPDAGLGWSDPDLAASPVEEGPPPTERSPGGVERLRGKRSPMRSLPLLALVALLAAVAWAGWVWWSGREVTEEPPATSRPVPRPIAPATPAISEASPSTPPSEAGTEGVESATPTVVTPLPTAPAPAPAPPPSPVASDPERARYQRRAESFAREGRSVAYALQFELVCQPESVARALEAGPSVWFVPIQYRGAPCFRVFWGRYETREAAERARDEIPTALRGSGPVVVQPRELLR